MSEPIPAGAVGESDGPRNPAAKRAAGRALKDLNDLGKKALREHKEGIAGHLGVFALLLVPAVVTAWTRPPALGYVAFAVMVAAYFGFVPLRRVLWRLRLESAALQEVAKLLYDKLDARALLELLQRRQADGLDAHQHVLLALEGEQPAGGAPPAFVEVEAGLDGVGYARNGVVLLGLFGTVLFFAQSLAGEQLNPDNLVSLLSDVRGALGCTLSGIAASLALGLAGSRAANLHDALVQRARELLSGPVAAAAATSTAPGNVWTEPQLWARMLAHFERFASDAAATHQKLGDNVAAHGAALQDLAQKLATAQAFTIPEGVAHFAPAAERFEQGVTLLHKAVDTLVTLVGNVNVKTPVVTLERLGGIEARQAEMEERTLAAVGAAREEQQGAGKVLDEMKREVQALSGRQTQAESKLETRLQEVKALTASAATAAAAAEQAARQILTAHTLDPRPLTQALALVAQGQAAAERSVTALQGQVRELGVRIEPLVREVQGAAESRAVLQTAADTLRAEAAGLQRGVGELGTLAGGIRSASAGVTSGAADLRRTTDELRTQARQSAMEQEASLRLLQAKVSQGFAQLEPVVAWNRRRLSGPLAGLRSLSLTFPRLLRRRRDPAVRPENARPSRWSAFRRLDPRAAPQPPLPSPAETAGGGDAGARPERRGWLPFRWGRPAASVPAPDAGGTSGEAGTVLLLPATGGVNDAPAPPPAPGGSQLPTAESLPASVPADGGSDVPAVLGEPDAPATLTGARSPEPSPEIAGPDYGIDAPGRMPAGPWTAHPITPASVHALYDSWVRDAAQPPVPHGWEVVPMRLVRVSQEHPAAVPVPQFEDASQLGDFVRFSPAGGVEGLVLPHPEAAHNPDVLALLFPEIAASGKHAPGDLPHLPPVRMHRQGEHWVKW